MADTLKDFLVGIGFSVDEASRRKVEETVNKSEATLSDATIRELKRRKDAEERHLTQRVTAIVGIGAELEREEKAHAEKLLKVHQEQADKDRKLQEDEAKKATERRAAAFKSMQAFALQAAAVATKAVVALEGVALGVTYAVDRTAKKFESLQYAAQRTNSSVRGITAFAYAASQLGSSVDEAGGSLERFGDNLKRLPGYENMLRRMGVSTRDAQGRMRDSADIATDFGASLRHMRDADPRLGYAKALAYGNALGLDENTTRAVMDPRFGQFEEQRKREQGAIGFDPNAAGKGALGFEQAMRRMQAVVEDVGDKIRASLFDKIGPLLDQFATWLQDNGKRIADVISSLGAAVVQLATAFAKSDVLKGAVEAVANGMQSLAKFVGSDDFKKDMASLADGIGRLAKAVVVALRWFGLLPGSANVATPPNGDSGLSAVEQGELGTMRAAYRGRSSLSDAVRAKANAYLDRLRGGGKAAPMPRGQAAANAAAIADELRKAGLPDEAIAASLGSMQQESGFNPSARNSVNGGHTGLIQWDSTRWPKIASWIKENGGDPQDPRWQARAYVAEGRARPGERLYDGPRTQRGFRMLEQSKGNLGLAKQGIVEIERFGFGEAGGRFANADAWLKTMPQSPAPTISQRVGSGPRLPPNAMYWATDSRGNRVAVDAQGRAVKSDGTPTTVTQPAAQPLPPPPLSTPTLGPTPALVQQYNQSRNRGDTSVSYSPTFNITGGDPQQTLAAARLSASRGQVDLLRNLQGAEQ